MKLYYSPGACSLSPHIVLHETGLPHQAVMASTRTKKLPDGTDFLTINARGQVPVLELDDGQRLTEGPAIVQYLADLAPATGLAPPAGSLARYRLMEWLNFITSELHKGFVPLFMPGWPEEAKTVSREKLMERFAWVDGQLAGQDWLMSAQGHDRFTVADAYLFTVNRWCPYAGMDTRGLAHLTAHSQRVAARPAVQAAMQHEGLLKAA